ncbi:MAG: sigma 54-interacting transcriptional regulator [Chromatiaceae bacterium]|nr:sigma 54-interacting transcriptional regulator [Chromatiaceae bacterium]
MNPPHSQNSTILLVDDNPTNLQLLFGTLKGLGHKLLIAKSGEDALKVAQWAQPDLILLDILMAGIDGFETCAQLKENPETRDIAVIFLSALDDTDDKIKGLSMGAVDYIAKPFQAEEVIARVGTHLTIARLRSELAERNRQLEAANQPILDSVGDGIYGLDLDGNITFANPAAVRLTGYPKESLIGHSLHELHLYARWDGSPYHFIESGIYQTLKQGIAKQSDSDVFWRQAGDHFAVAWTCTPIKRRGEVQGAVLAFRDVTQRKRQEHQLRDALGEVERLRDRLQAENAYLQAEVKNEGRFDSIVGESPALKNLLEQVDQVAPTNSSVLIVGESGTGKEAIARAIHDLSARRDRPLIKVNCGAITPTLIESELFGHEKGAFTGAIRQRQGHFELADGGTIFLDEVGELPLDAQVKLLRVLQEHEISRLGSENAIKVDVRVIAATNRDLVEMVEAGTFRMDLFYRLNVFPLSVPPLRDRAGDIPLLVAKFLSDQARAQGRTFNRVSEDGMRLLTSYHWPGNIRELQNVIERAAILARDQVVPIAPHMVYSGINVPSELAASTLQGAGDAGELVSLAENETRYIRQVLEQTGWAIAGKGGAAEILDLPASTLRSRMKKLGITRGD